MSLSVVQSFGLVTRQGPPFSGSRKFGVSIGGAFDQESLTLANACAQLPAGTPAWELSMAQAIFRADSAGIVACVGAAASVQFRGIELETGCVFQIDSVEEFLVESPTNGARVYVAFGNADRPQGWRIKLDQLPDSVAKRDSFRFVLGPQAELLNVSLFGQTFEVSRTGNRVGIRLEPSLGGHSIELPSEPQCVGTVQISNDGTPILLGPDGPTIGGYPKIGVVASCDHDRIGQLRPGDKVHFELVAVPVARELGARSRAQFRRRLELLRLAGI